MTQHPKVGFLSTTIDVQRSDFVAKTRTLFLINCLDVRAWGAIPNQLWKTKLALRAPSLETRIHGTNFYRKIARQPVVRLFTPYALTNCSWRELSDWLLFLQQLGGCQL